MGQFNAKYVATYAGVPLFAAKLCHGVLQRCQETHHEVLLEGELAVAGIPLPPASIGEGSDDLGEAGNDDGKQHDPQPNDQQGRDQGEDVDLGGGLWVPHAVGIGIKVGFC